MTETSAYGKEYIDSGLKSLAAMQQGFEEIAAEASEYGKRSYEASSQALGNLLTAKTFEEAIKIQTGYAKEAFEGLLAEATKLGELYAGVARDAYKPYESITKSAK